MSHLYLIPCTLGDGEPSSVIAQEVLKQTIALDLYFAENIRSARRYLKKAGWEGQFEEDNFVVVDKRTHPDEYTEMLMPILEGRPAGILSEAGCPGIADPGSALVEVAHSMGIKVVPLVGPSSILLAMMASGGNSQNFAFNGYLPINDGERRAALLKLEGRVRNKQTQIFMETPFRNQKMIDQIIKHVHPTLMLTVACDLTLPTEEIHSMPIKKWRTHKIDIHKRPAIFVLS